MGYMPQKTRSLSQKFLVKGKDYANRPWEDRGGGRSTVNGPNTVCGRACVDVAVKMHDVQNRGIGYSGWRAASRDFVACLLSLIRVPADEPTAGVDSAHQTEFYDLLSHLNLDEMGIAIVMVSHDVTAISKYVTRSALALLPFLVITNHD